MAKKSPIPDASQPEERVYVVYDARAEYDVDEAMVLFACDSLDEARKYRKHFSGDCVIYTYHLVDGVATDGKRVS
jgi:hypothetical protein